MTILFSLLIISVIIVVHEFGHFILAKANGITVDEFAVGVGPKIVQFKKNETVYCIKLLPFGGSCMMNNMYEETENDDKAFNSKGVWARISVVFAGPVFNFILAYILAVILIANMGYDLCRIYSVEEGSVAYEAGMREGDLITSINGSRVKFSRDYSIYQMLDDKQTLDLVFEHNGEKKTATLTPTYYESNVKVIGVGLNGTVISSVTDNLPAFEAGIKAGDIINKVNGIDVSTADEVISLIKNSDSNEIEFNLLRDNNEVTLSVIPKDVVNKGYTNGIVIDSRRTKVSPLKAASLGFAETGYWIKATFFSLKMLFSGKASVDDLSGPVGVVNIVGSVVNESKQDGAFYVFINIINLMLMLSANIGVMNLLPIPAVDGGRLVFLFIEAIFGKPISREKEGIIHFIGIVLLLLLMIVVTFNDIKKFF